jgi:RNA polymerase sigma-70 factor (ECF subfamily)
MLSKEKISLIYKQNSREIFRYLYRLTGNQETSEDILQEVFEKFIVYTAEKEIHKDKYRAFLYKTAHNICVNHLIKTRRIRFDNIDSMEDSLKTEDKNLEHFMADDLNHKIFQILDTVKPESRSMFMLNKETGMTYEEIARHLAVSARTVRRRIKEVLEILFDELKKGGFLA